VTVEVATLFFGLELDMAVIGDNFVIWMKIVLSKLVLSHEFKLFFAVDAFLKLAELSLKFLIVIRF